MFEEIVEKFNSYHGKDGKFSSKEEATSFTIKTKDPSKQYLADAAIERAKKEHEAEEKLKIASKPGNFKVMQSDEDIEKALGEDTEKWTDSLNGTETIAVEEYTGFGYAFINKYLRKEIGMEEADEGVSLGVACEIENLDNALAKSSNASDIVVHRGVSAKKMFDAKNIEDLEKLVGTEFPEKGYSSCGATAKKAWRKDDIGCYLQIEVPKGTGNGAYVDGLSRSMGEKEFLLPRNTSYVVTKVDIHPQNTPYVDDSPIIYCRLVQVWDEIKKFNPYHDRKGRFSSKDKSVLFTIKTKNPDKQYLADAAIERAKKEHEAESKVAKPKNAGEKVDWKKELASVQTRDDLTRVLEEYLPGAMDVTEDFLKRSDSGGSFYSPMVGDVALAGIYKKLGYDKKPTVVSTEEFDTMVANGSDVYYRGFKSSSSANKSGKEKADDFVYGETHFAGRGMFGNGTYASKEIETLEESGYKTARAYSHKEKDGIICFTMSKDTVFGTLEPIMNEVDSFCNEYVSAFERVSKNTESGQTDRKLESVHRAISDPSKFAALRGYDGYMVADEDFYSDYAVILNRGKCIIDEQRYS